MNEKPITTLGPWSYHNPIDMAADEQSFSINKEVKWMNKIDKKIARWERLKKYTTENLFELVDSGELVNMFFDVVDQLKKCREELKGCQTTSREEHREYAEQIERHTKETILKHIEKKCKGFTYCSDDGEYSEWCYTADDIRNAVQEAKENER